MHKIPPRHPVSGSADGGAGRDYWRLDPNVLAILRANEPSIPSQADIYREMTRSILTAGAAVDSQAVRVTDDNVLAIASQVLEKLEMYVPDQIQRFWILDKLPGWNAKVLERCVGRFLEAEGLPRGRGQFKRFVVYVKEHKERFSSPAQTTT